MPIKFNARLWLASLAAVSLVACASGGGQTQADLAWPTTTISQPASVGFSADGLAALDQRLAKAVADQDTAGLTYILVRHGQVVAFKSHGKQSETAPMTNESLFRIYSMSKPITGVAMMQLYEQGKWKLDDPITKFIPEFADLKELTWSADGKVVMGADGKPVLATPKRPATMRELMSHTAGFGYGLSGEDPVNKAFRDTGVLAAKDLNEMMAKIDAIPLIAEPGTRWFYSVAVDIQGYLVQKLSGQKFGDYLKQHVTGPMGMADTAFFVNDAQRPRFTDVYHWERATSKLVKNEDRPDRPGYFDANRLESGGGGLVATTHDYARFCQMMLNKGAINGKRILSPSSVALMTQNQIPAGLRVATDGTLPTGSPEAVGFGLDFAVYIDPSVGDQPYAKGTYYWGGAAGTWFWIDPVNDLFFVGMIQNQGGNRPGGMNFRADSAKLVYAALTDKAK